MRLARGENIGAIIENQINSQKYRSYVNSFCEFCFLVKSKNTSDGS